ncbi:MAG TPA: FAD:protein FMN transferase [Vicinamibacteria bacterium]|nr:FAD:protein FMN transferase [Vicinamibacteria bacterium]
MDRRDLFGRLAGRVPSAYWVRVHRRAMACRFEVALSGEDAAHVAAAREALDAVDRIEAALSVFRPDSALSALNRRAAHAPVPVDEELFALLVRCREIHVATDGAFDITTTPLSRAWGFLRRAGRLPSPEEIAAARAAVGLAHVRLDEARRSVAFDREGVELNLGAIGKGHALDRVAAGLGASGLTRALLSAGGSSALAVGGPFPIDLRPRAAGPTAHLTLWLRDGALGMSGAGLQFFEKDGRRYGHVLDPRTGWPAGGVRSAMVVATRAADADALSTAFLVGGPALAARYCAAHRDVLALVVPDDGDGAPLLFGAHPGAALSAKAARGSGGTEEPGSWPAPQVPPAPSGDPRSGAAEGGR